MRADRCLVPVLLAITSIAVAASAQQPGTSAPKAEAPPANSTVNATAAILLDFRTRIDQYLTVRKKAAKDAPSLKETTEPAKIKAAEEGLAATLRAARPNAQPGDIFTTDIQAAFRRLLAPELKGREGAHAKEVLKDDAPNSVPLKVNAKYPEGKPFPTVPSNLLLNLPTLPPEVEYRIVGKHLILRDTGADLIVDFIPNAIP